MKKDGIALSAFIASIVSVVIIIVMAAQAQGGFMAYFVSIVLYIAIFAILAFVFRNLELKINKYVYYALILGAMAAGVHFLVQAKATSGSASSIWVNYPNAINVLGLVLIIAISFSILLKAEAKVNLWPAYILASIMYGYNRYAPNLLLEDFFDIDAYVYSIYNVFHNVPYEWSTRGNYGHYGLFFKLPMMIFGSKYVTLSAMIGVIGGLAMLCFCFATDRLIKNSYIKVLVIFCGLAESLYMDTSSYYQTAPHRYVFIMIMMAWIAHCHTKPWKGDAIVGGIISSLAILWNLESGVATACAWCVYQMINYYQKNEKIVSIEILKYIVLIVVEFFAAMLIVAIYNICCGGKPDFLTFFYPVWTAMNVNVAPGEPIYNMVAAVNGASNVSAVATTLLGVASGITGAVTFSIPLKVGNYSYIYFVPLMLTAFAVPFVRIKLLKLENSTAVVCAPIATMAIVMYSYYMNRFYVLNAWVVMYEIAMLAGIIVDTSLPEIKEFILQRQLKNSLYKDLKTTVSVILVMGLSMIGFIGVCGIQQQAYVNLYTSKQDTTDIYNCVNHIKEIVPENTFAAGVGTVELYSMLGWDTGYHKMDFPDCGGEDLVALYDAIYAQNEVFLNQEMIEYTCDYLTFMENGNFVPVETFEFGNQNFQYLRKADYQ